MMKERKKSWDEKVSKAEGSYLRARNNIAFAKKFYQNLFLLNPEIEAYFKDTDFKYQEKALINGVNILFSYLHKDEFAKSQISRLSKVHNIGGLKIHPHLYYYWIEALIITIQELDNSWYDDLAYYLREVINYPVSFFTSQYFLPHE
ncbi:globin domain-containing protein [Halobacteriovorax sp.]|uniref:globin domain-containing protein n=1 Tax=Halobacteriovorax sp. TaxID=2020862 RepID=UPI003563F020